MPERNKSTIVRNWKTTIGFLVAALVSAGISALLFMTIAEGPITIGIACIPAVIAIICMVVAVSGAGQCACPECGQMVDGLSTGGNDGKLCPHCLKYFEGTGGQLWATDESKIADRPTFTSPLPEPFSFPEGCCVCGSPATQRITITMTTQNAGGSLGGVAASAITDGMVSGSSRTRTSIQVPHCDAHKDGASLTGTANKTHIRFRSYPYLRAFCELNKTKPG